MKKQMKNFSNYERGFIEAFLETDGCISISIIKNKITKRNWVFRIKLEFCNNSTDLLNKLKKMLEIGIINHSYCKCKKLVINASDCKWILPQLSLTFKNKKKVLALKILDHVKIGSYKSKEYENKMNELHKETIFLRNNS